MHPSPGVPRLVLLSFAALALAAHVRAAPDDDGAFFRDRVLPVLEARCFECHGPEARRAKGGLRLNGREALLVGGSSGPAVVPGDPDASLLVSAVRRSDPELAMPPKFVLPDDELAVLVEWVRRGAPWPAGAADAIAGPAVVGPQAPLPATADGAADVPPRSDPEAVAFFEQRVRPLLVEQCYECHGPERERVKGDLRLGSRAGLLRGGLTGPAVVSGAPDASLLITAVRYANGDLQMPPDRRLSDAQIADLSTWIAMGAPWPGDEGVDHGAEQHAGIDLEEGRLRWAFRKVQRPAVPGDDPVRNPIDAFIDARLSEAGIAPNPRADRRTLARRVYADLLGLPPTREALDAFAADERPDAVARLVDALLARREYGERWARHWLDVVRYGQTDGYERDAEKPFAWRYRDWVIDAFADDMPYDRFVREQLAGDELGRSTGGSLIATGFYRLGVWDAEPDDDLQAEFDELDDVVRTVGEGFLGVTLGCARCHDHKFDPIGQEDYYATLAFVRGLRPYAEPRYALDAPTLTPLGLDQDAFGRWERQRALRTAELEAEQKRMNQAARERVARERLAGLPPEVTLAWDTKPARRSAAQQALLDAHPELDVTVADLSEALPSEEARALKAAYLAVLDVQKSFQGDLDWALVAREGGPVPPPTHVLGRGLASLPLERVEPHFPRVLCADDDAATPDIPRPAPHADSSGRRLALADWIASPDNPLTARVMVNRIWQHHFGRGLVPTPNDFGATGVPPRLPELLDWLAAEFMDSGWSVKHMHRLILASDAWQRASAERADVADVDPDNELLWRQELRRFDAEALRDAIVSVSGGLSAASGGRGFFPAVSREALAGGARPGEGLQIDPPDERDRRSIYAFVKRSMLPPVLEAFDYVNTSLPVGGRVRTTSSSQAFVLLNGAFMERQSERLTERVLAQAGGDPAAQVRLLFECVLGRDPTVSERALMLEHLAGLGEGFAAVPPSLVFHPRLPGRCEEAFLSQLSGHDVLAGPEQGWSFLKGPWVNPYSSTLALDVDRGPAALLDGAPIENLRASALLRLHDSTQVGAMVLRGQAHGAVFTGVELRLEPGLGRLSLRVHQDDGERDASLAQPPTELAAVELPLPAGPWTPVVVEARGSRVRVWWGEPGAQGEPLIDVTDARLAGSGAFGVRTWGGPLELRELTLTGDDGVAQAVPVPVVEPERRALRSLALTLLNTNEFAYID